MFHKLTLKITKFQLPSPKRFSTVGKNILEDHHAPLPMSNRVKPRQKLKYADSDDVINNAQKAKNYWENEFS